jgi:hypothetical protein
MLWWFIGVWLASGAVLPAFWLLSMACRWLASATIGPKRLCVLSGLVGIGIGALILLFVCSFSDSITTTHDMPSAFAVAQAPLTRVVEASPIPLRITLSPSPAQSARDGASHQTDKVVPQAAIPAALLTVALHPKLDAKPSTRHRHALEPPVLPYVTRSSSRGIWLFAPNGNEGTRN